MDAPQLHGRDEVLAALAAALDTARLASTGVLISGEAGIGKTALIDAGVEMAHGYGVLRVTGVPIEADMAFSGLRQLLRPLRASFELIPPRQRLILDSALSLSGSAPPDVLAVAGAVLAVLAVLAGADSAAHRHRRRAMGRSRLAQGRAVCAEASGG